MLDPRDATRLREHGLDPDDARRQLGLLAGPAPRARLVRPCTIADGIERLDTPENLARVLAVHAAAASAGRVSCLVPASGAATRMVAALVAVRSRADRGARRESLAASGDPASLETLRVLDGLPRLPQGAELDTLLARRGLTSSMLIAAGRCDVVLDALLGADGLGLGSRPKGLVAFHTYEGQARTAFEEQLVEAAVLTRDSSGRGRAHFTVTAAHLDAFREAAGAGQAARLDVDFSCQEPATDTLALDADGRPLRDASGRLVLRPGGHGALLDNLSRIDGDVVAIRNIDNVQRAERALPDRRRALVGRLVELQSAVFAACRALREARPDAAALESAATLAREFGRGVEGRAGDREALLHALERPIRVCGVVPNTGEPGGGPFWVAERDGRSTPQIVERSQIDEVDPEQRAVAAAATHFNPVDLVCGLRAATGRPYDLRRYVAEDQAIVTRKMIDGREVTVLERPGLWNGAMAGWLTRFVELPLATFTPVKTLGDLLRPEHQPPDAGARLSGR